MCIRKEEVRWEVGLTEKKKAAKSGGQASVMSAECATSVGTSVGLWNVTESFICRFICSLSRPLTCVFLSSITYVEE
jgi:hypothetical protein